ncbi:hypothetical protein [Aureimonas sp. AU20]|nr:hypothetical protein [Aureimonas sp. AU20]ALN73532.1 hypothetical protein M673_12465 [Aureimonas sp. AU20]
MSVQADGQAPSWAHALAREVNAEVDRLKKQIADLEKRVKTLETP